MKKTSTKKTKATAKIAISSVIAKKTERFNEGKIGRPLSALGFKKHSIIIDTLAKQECATYSELIRAALTKTGLMTAKEANQTPTTAHRSFITHAMESLEGRGIIEAVSDYEGRAAWALADVDSDVFAQYGIAR